MTSPRSFLSFLALGLLIVNLAAAAAAQRGEGQLDSSPPQGITEQEIIQKFAAKEKEFKTARENYAYRQSLTVQTLDGDTVNGEFKEVEDVLFDDKGNRIEHVVFAPQSSLVGITMTKEDFDDIRRRMPFVLTSDEIPEYQILYVGKQRIDEIGTYVFDVAPKQIEKNKRYFQGRIWVDDTDFQIVKTYGKNVPDLGVKKRGGQENLFPAFTTWRDRVDGKYWFPVYTKVDDVLHFSNGDIHIKQVVKYTDYKRFGSNVKITYEGQDIGKGAGKDSGTQPTTGQQPPASTPPKP
ncbi:MAG TPA: hypothetical protein VN620_01180 [Candidatus Methylomirabilis sp.]|nr:hypothetical protein [Candidatus Methylomirabilis sp.]